jgi:hypothetical protein
MYLKIITVRSPYGKLKPNLKGCSVKDEVIIYWSFRLMGKFNLLCRVHPVTAEPT